MAKKPAVMSVYKPGDTPHTSPIDAAAEYKAGLSLDNLELSDIVDVLADIPGRGDEVEEQRMVALQEKNSEADEGDDDVSTPSATGMTTQVKSELAIGTMLGKDYADLEEGVADKKEDVDGAVLGIVRIVDNNEALRKVLDAPDFPQPGTRWDAEETDGRLFPGNRPPDYYKRQGDTGAVFTNIFLGTLPGQRLVALKEVMGRYGSSDHSAEQLAADAKLWNASPRLCAYEDLGKKGTYQATRGKLNARITNGANRFRAAQRFRLQRAAILAEKHVRLQYIGGGLDKIVTATLKTPIELVFMGDQFGGTIDTGKPKSVGTFNRYDVPAAIGLAKAAGTYLTQHYLDETVKKSTGGTKKGAIPAHLDNEQVTQAAFAIFNYIDPKGDQHVKRQAALVTACRKDASILRHVGDLYNVLGDDIMPLIQDLYNADVLKQQAEELAEAKAKAERLAHEETVNASLRNPDGTYKVPPRKSA